MQSKNLKTDLNTLEMGLFKEQSILFWIKKVILDKGNIYLSTNNGRLRSFLIDRYRQIGPQHIMHKAFTQPENKQIEIRKETHFHFQRRRYIINHYKLLSIFNFSLYLSQICKQDDMTVFRFHMVQIQHNLLMSLT